MRVSRIALVAGVCAVALPAAAHAQAGSLDPSFGGDGIVLTNIDQGDDYAHGLALQPNGKLVAVGESGKRLRISERPRFALTRYRPNGRLDLGFGAKGRVVTDFAHSFYDIAYDLALQPDGKVVAVGTGGFGRFALARYNPDGSLDSSFGGDGKVVTKISSGLNTASAVAIQGDGKIVVAGAAGGQTGSHFGVARYNTDGSLDMSFGGDGKVLTNFTPRADGAEAVRVQSDGKIVVAGTANSFCCDSQFALARYNTDGSLDASFGGDGRVTTDFTFRRQGYDGAYALVLQPDGRIVAAGQAGEEKSSRGGHVGVTRYNSDGTLDSAFGGGDGKVFTNLSRGLDFADDLELQADGKIVVSCVANSRGNTKFAVVRYRPGGGRDNSFGGDGRVKTNLSRGHDRADALVLQADGSIVAAGVAGAPRGVDSRFALVRYRGA